MLRKRFVWRRFVWRRFVEETSCKVTFCMCVPTTVPEEKGSKTLLEEEQFQGLRGEEGSGELDISKAGWS